MGAISMFENLPLGFRFKPTDVELIDHYLRLKINGRDDDVACIKEVDICRVEPWDLPDLSVIKTYDHEWFFFCPRDRKYPNGQRSNRATGAGYWKATGKDRTIKSRKMGLIGMKKTLVFYTGRAPKGQRTSWVIHEYRPTLEELDGTNPGQGAFVLCRLFKKADELKQDEHDDGSNIEEAEMNILSPNQTNISQEDVRSELAVVHASPLSVEQTVEQQKTPKNCMVKTSGSISSEAAVPDYSHSYSYGNISHKSHVNEEIAHEVDSHIAVNGVSCEADFCGSEAMEYYNDDYLKPQMHLNQGIASIEPFITTDIGDGQNGFQFQDIDERDPISNFLDCVFDQDDPFNFGVGTRGPALNEKDMREGADIMGWNKASMNESGSCSGSDVELPQLQHDNGFIGFQTPPSIEPKLSEQSVKNISYTDDDDIFSDAALERFCNSSDVGQQLFNQNSFVKAENGNYNAGNKIQIRSYGRTRAPQPTNFVHQGTASRRIHLLWDADNPISEAEQKEPEESTVTEESCLSADFEDYSTTMVSHKDLISIDELNDSAAGTDRGQPSIDDGQVVESGIKIKIRPRKNQSHAARCVKQGTASQRLRLQKFSGESFNAEDDLTPINELIDGPAATGERQPSKDDGQVVESAIKYKTRPRKIQHRPIKCVKQGTTSQRLRSQKLSGESFSAEDDNGKPLAAKTSNSSEEIGKKSCEPSWNKRPGSSKSSAHRLALYISIILLFMAAFFSMVLIGLRKTLNADYCSADCCIRGANDEL